MTIPIYEKIKVLIVDDSKMVQALLSEIIAKDEELQVIGVASDPYEARDKIKALNPDVITLDVEMPKMDGVTFLKNLIHLHPMPVVMLSTFTQMGAVTTLECLKMGAVDFLPKPAQLSHAELSHFAFNLHNKLKMASKVKVANLMLANNTDALIINPDKFDMHTLIAIGSSTGGIVAIQEILQNLPAEFPPIVITQHIPEHFSLSFAKRLNDAVPMEVQEAWHDLQIQPGNVYIAPGHSHLTIKSVGNKLYCQLNKHDLVNGHRPSVEVMFQSLLDLSCTPIIAVMLTGMGEDGSKAMVELKNKGAHTIAQDEATSVVWGMAGTAVKHNGVNDILPIGQIVPKLIQLVTRNSS